METIAKRHKVEYYGQQKKEFAAKKVLTKNSKLNMFSLLGFFSVFLFSFLFYTWVHMQAVHISYEIAQSKKLESEYLEENKKLRTEVATLTTPVRIKKLANNKLGLKPPEKDQVVIIK